MVAAKAVIVLALMGFASAIPPHGQISLMARYILQEIDWVAIGTTSVSKNIEGYPFVGLKSISDGPKGQSSGIPYLYMTDLDLSGIDLNHDNRVSLLATLSSTDYCKQNNMDPQDPRCARAFITGRFVKVQDPEEKEFAKKGLFEKHPGMATWPEDHGFFVGKVDIEQIAVIDFFGGANYVDLDEYYKIKL